MLKRLLDIKQRQEHTIRHRIGALQRQRDELLAECARVQAQREEIEDLRAMQARVTGVMTREAFDQHRSRLGRYFERDAMLLDRLGRLGEELTANAEAEKNEHRLLGKNLIDQEKLAYLMEHM